MTAVEIATVASPIVAAVVGLLQAGVIAWGIRAMVRANDGRTKADARRSRSRPPHRSHDGAPGPGTGSRTSGSRSRSSLEEPGIAPDSGKRTLRDYRTALMLSTEAGVVQVQESARKFVNVSSSANTRTACAGVKGRIFDHSLRICATQSLTDASVSSKRTRKGSQGSPSLASPVKGDKTMRVSLVMLLMGVASQVPSKVLAALQVAAVHLAIAIVAVSTMPVAAGSAACSGQGIFLGGQPTAMRLANIPAPGAGTISLGGAWANSCLPMRCGRGYPAPRPVEHPCCS